jgi:hypothetical protein
MSVNINNGSYGNYSHFRQAAPPETSGEAQQAEPKTTSPLVPIGFSAVTGLGSLGATNYMWGKRQRKSGSGSREVSQRAF